MWLNFIQRLGVWNWIVVILGFIFKVILYSRKYVYIFHTKLNDWYVTSFERAGSFWRFTVLDFIILPKLRFKSHIIFIVSYSIFYTILRSNIFQIIRTDVISQQNNVRINDDLSEIPVRGLDHQFLWHSIEEGDNATNVHVTTCRNSVQGKVLIVDDRGNSYDKTFFKCRT